MRKSTTLALDERLIAILKAEAEERNLSFSRLVENTLKQQFMPKEAKNV